MLAKQSKIIIGLLFTSVSISGFILNLAVAKTMKTYGPTQESFAKRWYVLGSIRGSKNSEGVVVLVDQESKKTHAIREGQSLPSSPDIILKEFKGSEIVFDRDGETFVLSSAIPGEGSGWDDSEEASEEASKYASVSSSMNPSMNPSSEVRGFNGVGQVESSGETVSAQWPYRVDSLGSYPGGGNFSEGQSSNAHSFERVLYGPAFASDPMDADSYKAIDGDALGSENTDGPALDQNERSRFDSYSPQENDDPLASLEAYYKALESSERAIKSQRHSSIANGDMSIDSDQGGVTSFHTMGSYSDLNTRVSSVQDLNSEPPQLSIWLGAQSEKESGEKTSEDQTVISRPPTSQDLQDE